MYAFLLFLFVRVICGGGVGQSGGGGVVKSAKIGTACKISKMIKTAFSVFIFLVEYRS